MEIIVEKYNLPVMYVYIYIKLKIKRLISKVPGSVSLMRKFQHTRKEQVIPALF